MVHWLGKGVRCGRWLVSRLAASLRYLLEPMQT